MAPKGGFKSAKRAAAADDDDDEVLSPPKTKKARTEGRQKDDEGNEYWEISHNRRVGISDFKGKTLVNLREYYEKDGKTLPGKKGISLTLEQYIALLEVIPDIEKALKEKGEKVPRPNFADSSKSVVDEGDEEEEDDDEEE